jgi:hypothetical protein
MPINTTINVTRFLRSRWRHPAAGALIVFTSLTVCLLFTSFDLVKGFTKDSEGITWLVILGVSFLAFLIWSFARRIPTTKRGRIGFPIAIRLPKADDHREVLEKDFLDALKREISSFSTTASSDCFIVNEYYCKQAVNDKGVIKLLKRTHGHCLLWGEVKVRHVNGAPHYVTDMRWAVSHRPIPRDASSHFAQDVGQVWESRQLVPLANDLVAFEFSSRYFGLVIRYVVGTAAFVSQDPLCAVGLFEELCNRIGALPAGPDGLPPQIRLLRHKAIQSLVQCYGIIALLHYRAWRRSRSADDMTQMKVYIDRLLALEPNDYNAHLGLAIWQFVTTGDVVAAKDALPGTLNKPDSTWLYNLAFLQAYEGHLSDAHKTYKQAFKGQCSGNVPIQSEEFICWVLENTPDKVQLYFCLGLINYYDKKDYAQAKEHFERFLANAPIGSYKKPINIANHCIAEAMRFLEQETYTPG